MNSFSINRLCKTFRWYFGMNIRSTLAWTGGFTVAVFLCELMFFVFSTGQYEMILDNMAQFGVTFILIALAIGVSTFLYDFNKKVKRVTFLMLPATNLEKFLSAVFYIVIVYTVAVLLSVVVGDTLRMVFRSLAYGDEWVSAIPQVMKGLIPNIVLHDDSHVYSVSFKVMSLVVGYSFILWIHSLYTLGGTLLRKYAFVVTSVAMIFFMMVLSWVINHLDVSMFTSQWDGNAYVSEEVGVFAYVLAIMIPLFSIFNYWTSFHIFKGYQLITNKWTNYDFLK